MANLSDMQSIHKETNKKIKIKYVTTQVNPCLLINCNLMSSKKIFCTLRLNDEFFIGLDSVDDWKKNRWQMDLR